MDSVRLSGVPVLAPTPRLGRHGRAVGRPGGHALLPRLQGSRNEAPASIAWDQRLHHEHGVGLWLLSCATGEFAGNCGLTLRQLDGVSGLGRVSRPAALLDRGLVTKAAAARRDYARDVLGVDWSIAIIDPRNRPSHRVAEKLGLALEWHTDHQGRWPSSQCISSASL